MGTTAAFVIAKQRGIANITTGELNQFRNKFVENSRMHAQLTYEQSGPKGQQQFTFTAEFTGHVDYNYVEGLLHRISHPYAVGHLKISQPAPRDVRHS